MGEVGVNEFWKGKRVLITGHAGFLGSRLANILSVAGVINYGIDRREQYLPYDSNLQKRRSWFENVFICDVTDRYDLEHRVAEVRPDIIFHLAAISQVVDAIHAPVQTFNTSIMGTVNVLDVARLCGFSPAVVVASSDKAYGQIDPFVKLANEDTLLDPVHPYDVSKAAADFIARSYAEIYELQVGVTRCGNIYGPGDRNWQRIIPGVIRWILKGETPIIRSDGTFMREYNYVYDIVDAYLRVGEYLMEGGVTGVSWTISDADGYLSVLEVVDAINNVMGLDINNVTVEIEGGASEEEKSIQLDSSMIRESLGWKSSMGLKAGIARTVDWISEDLRIPMMQRKLP